MLRIRDTVSPCGRIKTCGICSVLYVCVSSCNLSPRSDYNRFVLLGLYRPWDRKRSFIRYKIWHNVIHWTYSYCGHENVSQENYSFTRINLGFVLTANNSRGQHRTRSHTIASRQWLRINQTRLSHMLEQTTWETKKTKLSTRLWTS